MKNQPIPPGPSSAGLPGVLRLAAGLVILALAGLASLVVLDLVPVEQVLPHGRRIVLLAVVFALAASGIAGLIAWGRRS
jgi:hypothetical protein